MDRVYIAKELLEVAKLVSGESRRPTARGKIRGIETAIENWRRLPRSVREIIQNADNFRTTNQEVMFYIGRQLVGTGSIFANEAEEGESRHPLFHSIKSIEVENFWIKDENGRPKKLF